MNRQTLWMLIAIGLAVLFTAGCTKPVPACNNSDYSAMSSWGGSDFYNYLPADGDVVTDLTPSIGWEMFRDCQPGSYQINLKSETGTDFGGTASGNANFWTPSSLEPGTEYFWRVKAYSEDESMMGGPTIESNFYTGPLCTGSSLVPPTPLTPSDGAYAYHFPDAKFTWDYPHPCLPEYYKFQMATDPGFSNVFVTDFSHSPSKTHRPTLPKCMTAWWRVAAVAEGTVGPYSTPRQLSFVHENTCWLNHEPSVEFAVIRGTIFEDICPDTSPYLPPDAVLLPGCVYDTEFGIHGNGVRARGYGGESVLSYMTVNLGAGSCPSIGLSNTYAGSNGRYLILVQSPGEYCLSVTEKSYWDNGLWTEPLMDQETAEVTITVNPGDTTIIQNFAWDDYNVLFIELELLANTFCRRGPSMLHQPDIVAEIGSRIPVIARNEDASWLLTKVGDFRCYVYNPDDPEKYFNLPIFDPVPEPEPVEDKPDKPKSVNCSEFTNSIDCNSNSKCIWHTYVIKAGGYCTNK